MRLLDEQRTTNRSTAGWYEEYREHRENTTRVSVEGVAEGSTQRLCLLGAGNCLDVELGTLARHFAEIHLVDIDREALEGARERQPPEVRERLVLHAPVDLSGMADKLERWKRMEVTEAELLEHHTRTARALAAELGTFDRVVSTSLITQMQFDVVNVLGDQHRLFDAVRYTLGVTHLHTLYELTRPGGRALIVTDVLASKEYRYLDRVPPETDRLKLLGDVIAADRVIYVARPGFLHLLRNQDPVLAKHTTFGPPFAAWLWQNGPTTRFLVYAMALDRTG